MDTQPFFSLLKFLRRSEFSQRHWEFRNLIANNCTKWRESWVCSHRMGDGWILLKVPAPLPLIKAFSARSIFLENTGSISQAWICGSGSGSTPKCHGSWTLAGSLPTYQKFFWDSPFKTTITNNTFHGGTREWNCHGSHPLFKQI